jgi:hypothetical protein
LLSGRGRRCEEKDKGQAEARHWYKPDDGKPFCGGKPEKESVKNHLVIPGGVYICLYGPSFYYLSTIPQFVSASTAID